MGAPCSVIFKGRENGLQYTSNCSRCVSPMWLLGRRGSWRRWIHWLNRYFTQQKQHKAALFFLQEGDRDSYVCLCFAPFNLNDKIRIGILGEKVAVWLTISVDIKNRVKHPDFYFIFYSIILQCKVNDSSVLPL